MQMCSKEAHLKRVYIDHCTVVSLFVYIGCGDVIMSTISMVDLGGWLETPKNILFSDVSTSQLRSSGLTSNF